MHKGVVVWAFCLALTGCGGYPAARPAPLDSLSQTRVNLAFTCAKEQFPKPSPQAVACQFMTVRPHSGGMSNATLETVVRRFGDAEQALFISLSPPMGKNLEMQCGFWAWLQAYMNNGPWFDEDGQRSESDAYVKQTVEIGKFRFSDNVARYWRIIRGRESNGISEKPRVTDFVMLGFSLIFFPMFKLQDFTYAIAKRHSRGQWPQLVKERLHPDGPITRLVDLERAQELDV
ncbi:hypothetical protein [Pseudomonas sp. PDM17]|uniref:hypothetical protein n=1 Tax=Pseudomonas sp. PDM17 TaxID=2769285 RepID=UPI001CE1C289|nr:hypothetical protein [Pseudomonas sp. PDM17]